jgi:signal transduction histidine kinase
MARWATALAVVGGGLAVGLFSLSLAVDETSVWFAGRTALGAVALLGAGWALIGCGLTSWLLRPGRFGALLAAAGFAWFLLEWNNPAIGSAAAFTIGLCLYASCPPLVAHAVLADPGGRVRPFAERAALTAAYVANVLLLGVLPTLVFDPEAEACGQCPENLLLVTGDASLHADLIRTGVVLGLVWTTAVVALLGYRLVRGPGANRLVPAAGAAYLGLVAVWFAASLDVDYLAAGTLERRLWLGQAAALMVLVSGVGRSWLRARRARRDVARLVVDLAQSPPPGGLREALSGIVGDPQLVVAYPLQESGRLVDASGRTVEVAESLEQTVVVRDGRSVAVLGHRPGLLADQQLIEEVTAAARLALENERLQAEIRARVEELRASRARIVEAADTERMRLERDLHDGAQQRLVALSLSVGMLRVRLGDTPELVSADAELRAAIQELRELAHGIFPAVLADEGLAAAVEALAEDGRVPIRICGVPDGRYAAAVETAAYTVVAEAARTASSGLDVRAEQVGATLVVEVEARDVDGLDLVALEDRVGALDGRLAVQPRESGGVTIRAELPCES